VNFKIVKIKLKVEEKMPVKVIKDEVLCLEGCSSHEARSRGSGE
jgi:hypothetical protein